MAGSFPGGATAQEDRRTATVLGQDEGTTRFTHLDMRRPDPAPFAAPLTTLWDALQPLALYQGQRRAELVGPWWAPTVDPSRIVDVAGLGFLKRDRPMGIASPPWRRAPRGGPFMYPFYD